jgi:FG-GAP-like repeat
MPVRRYITALNRSRVTGTLFWRQNDGQGSFATPAMLAATSLNRDFSVADFNRDGKPEYYLVGG